eukprot:scaffold8460_cov166-Amphora_coffeaeformis.AAC.3
MRFFAALFLLASTTHAFVPTTTTTPTAPQTASTTSLYMTKDFDLVRGFETMCLHAGYLPDPTTTSRGVPLYRTAPYVFKDTETAANLFGLKELGNIYSKYMQQHHIAWKRYGPDRSQH